MAQQILTLKYKLLIFNNLQLEQFVCNLLLVKHFKELAGPSACFSTGFSSEIVNFYPALETKLVEVVHLTGSSQRIAVLVSLLFKFTGEETVRSCNCPGENK